MTTNKTRPRKRRKLTAKERVLVRYPNASCDVETEFCPAFVYSTQCGTEKLGTGDTARHAWADAASRLGRKP